MQAYKYVAKSQINGKPIEAVIYAHTAREALEKISELGYIAESLEKIDASDRRVYGRVNVQLPVWFNRFNRERESEFDTQALSVNISAGGILLKTEKSFSEGTIIELMLELSEREDAIHCLGRVIRCGLEDEGKFYNIAVTFLDLSYPERNRLSEFLNKAGQKKQGI